MCRVRRLVICRRHGMRRGVLLQLIEDCGPLQLVARGGVGRINRIAPRCTIFLVDKLRDRNLREVRIAHKFCAIKERPPERFRRVMNRLSRPVSQLREIVAFQNIQRLNQDRPAGRRRRRADDLVSAISAANRFALLYFVVRQIVSRDQPSAFPHRGR